MNREVILCKAICRNGPVTQSVVAMEECSELIKEISKFLRGQGDKDNLTEEMADVRICLEQLQLIYDVSAADIDRQVQAKLDRLQRRLENEDR